MKVYYFLTIIVGLMILFNIAGINTTTGYVLNYLDIVDNPQNFQDTNLYNTIIAIFITAVVGGVVIGYFTKSSPESYLIAPFCGLLVLFVGDIISIYSYVSGLGIDWIKYIVMMILIPLALGFCISIVEFWRGTD